MISENKTYLNFDDAFLAVKNETERAIKKSPYIVRMFLSHLLKSNGKYLRAQSLIACALNSENLVDEAAVKAACAVEILHLATLVHDDIIDDSDLRRGSETLQKKYGKRTAVICGDYLFSLALKILSSIENKNDYKNIEIPDYVAKICQGELLQHVNNGNLDLSVYNYLRIASGKTAALFEACYLAGAYFSGCSDEDYKKYKIIGRYAGMVFQLTDDLMDYEATRNIAKKPVQSDFEQNVITLPLIYAIKKSDDLKKIIGNKKATKDMIKKHVFDLGGIMFAREVANNYYNKALKLLDELDLTAEKKEKLLMIIKKTNRVFNKEG